MQRLLLENPRLTPRQKEIHKTETLSHISKEFQTFQDWIKNLGDLQISINKLNTIFATLNNGNQGQKILHRLSGQEARQEVAWLRRKALNINYPQDSIPSPLPSIQPTVYSLYTQQVMIRGSEPKSTCMAHQTNNNHSLIRILDNAFAK